MARNWGGNWIGKWVGRWLGPFGGPVVPPAWRKLRACIDPLMPRVVVSGRASRIECEMLIPKIAATLGGDCK